MVKGGHTWLSLSLSESRQLAGLHGVVAGLQARSWLNLSGPVLCPSTPCPTLATSPVCPRTDLYLIHLGIYSRGT